MSNEQENKSVFNTPFVNDNPPFALSKNTDSGVSPHYVWFYMRCSYGKEGEAKSYLDSLGFQTFLPTQEVMRVMKVRQRDPKTGNIIYSNRRKRITESLIPNALFIHTTASDIHPLLGQPPLQYLHHYYVPALDNEGNPIEFGRKPLIIPDNQMHQFIRWAQVNGEDKYYRAEQYTFTKGDRVRVLNGKFEGFEGQVVRIKGQKRVGVNIQGIGFIATSYIPQDCLEKIEE